MLAAFIDSHQLQVLDCTPSLLSLLLAQNSDWWSQTHLRYLLVGGEPIDTALWSALLTLRKSFGIITLNLYGPTECTVDTTWCEIQEDQPEGIGRALPNTLTLITDPHGQLVPKGVVGELCVGGVGLARGYWQDTTLTRELFIANTLAPQWGDRLYNTGDLVRMRNDGQLEYKGRLDTQVKIRGYRVELNEVASHLRDHPMVRDAVVRTWKTEAHTQLVAYVCLEADADEATARLALLSGLKKRLPNYMVPSAIQVLTALPLTVNGKVDVEALPVPAQADFQREEYRAPTNTRERTLCEIWEEVLQCDEVGTEDNFFDLGGHSLLAAKLVDLCKKQLGLSLPVKKIFAMPTVREMAAYMDSVSAVQEGLYNHLLVLKTGNKEHIPPLILVHPVEGTVFCYHALASSGVFP